MVMGSGRAASGRPQTTARAPISRCARSDRDMPKPRLLRRSFFARSVHAVAPDLIGATLLFKGMGGIIVELEAYHHTDPAAHSFVARTARNPVMVGHPGPAHLSPPHG